MEVEILDLNDNQPQFEVEMYNISIVENLPNGFSVLQVVATDIDQVCLRITNSAKMGRFSVLSIFYTPFASIFREIMVNSYTIWWILVKLSAWTAVRAGLRSEIRLNSTGKCDHS